MKCRVLLGAACFLVVLAGYLVLAKPLSCKPSAGALECLRQSARTIELGWGGSCYVFAPGSGEAPRKGFILYPGGLIDARAYAPFMQAVAELGYLAVLAAMPLDLAVFGYARAGAIIDSYPGIETWALGGHSLGGVMACRYALRSPAKISGLILLASYPSHRFRLENMNLKALSIFGTSDGLTKVSDIEASKQHLPAETRFVEIPGGNHSQFCSLSEKDKLYRGDNPAAISPAQQQRAIIDALAGFFASL